MKVGGPPVEMETAFARVSCAPSEAAHACKADIEGKWISAILWKGARPPCAELNTFVATILVLPANLSMAIGTCCSKIESLKLLEIGRNRVDNYKLCRRHTASLFVMNAGISLEIE